MTTFDKREQAAENKFTHDAELLFKINIHRNNLAALWAAQKMGLNADDTKAYAAKLVSDTVTDTSLATVLEKITHDFLAHGLDIDKETIVDILHELEILARGDVLAQ